jgi:hypothetical protein
MERLYFVCPNTRREIDVGIDSDLNTLLRIRSKHVLARCRLAEIVMIGRCAKRSCCRPLDQPLMVPRVYPRRAINLLRMPKGRRDFALACVPSSPSISRATRPPSLT